MKKNAMLKIAAILLVAVLLTTCAISTTFAKYVTNTADYAPSEARVAKWGLTFTSANADIFTENDGVCVSNASQILLAPGLSGNGGVDVVIAGKPEVAFRLVATATVTISDNWKYDGNEYFPISFNVGGSEIKIDATNKTIADVADALEQAIAKALVGGGTFADGKATKDYAPDTELLSTIAPTVTWTWPQVDANDVKDTALGNAATTGDLTITIDYTLRAEQILHSEH